MSAESNSVAESVEKLPLASRQFATFFLGDRLYGIDVMQVQEVTNALPVTPIRLAPPFVKGLTNLRGQIATAIGLRDLFGLEAGNSTESMTVVCKVDGNLLSLLVDKIGDVVEVMQSSFEPTPDVINGTIKRFMTGVYKTDGPILSVIGISKLAEVLNKSVEVN